MLECSILLVLIIFAATTMFYLILYWRISSKSPEPHAPRCEDIDIDEKITKLRSTLPSDYAELERLLEELKEIRKKAELLLDEGGGSEGEGSGDKRSPKGD